MRFIHSVLFLGLISMHLFAENGHQLWLRSGSGKSINVVCNKKSSTLNIAEEELKSGWKGQPGKNIYLIIKRDDLIKGDGFILSDNKIQANTDLGILYGVYELLRRQNVGEDLKFDVCNPSYEYRILNHWDNLDGTIERG